MPILTWISKLKQKITTKVPKKKKKQRDAYEIFDIPDLNRDSVLGDAQNMTFQRIFEKDMASLKGVAMDAKTSNTVQGRYGLTGYGIPLIQIKWFAQWGFIGYPMCAMLAQHWLINKACTMPAEDAVRNGFDIGAIGGKKIAPDVIEKLRVLDKKYELNDRIIQFIRFGRIFGISAMKLDFNVDDPEEWYENPFNIDGVKPGTYRGLVKIEAWWLTPMLDGISASDPAQPHFYEPTWWSVQGKKIHRSHFVFFINGEVSDLLKATYFYGGIPLTQMMANRVYAAERVADEAPALTMTKRSVVMKTDLKKASLNPKVFKARIEKWVNFLSNFGVRIIDNADAVEQIDTSLAEVDTTTMTQYQLAAAIADVPATKLLGTSPKGFGASGEYEETNYHEFLKSLQANKASILIERHHQCAIRSDLAVNEQFDPNHTWRPLDSTTAKGVAENNKLKAETDQINVASGAIDGVVVMKRLKNDPNSGYSGIIEDEDETRIDEERDDGTLEEEKPDEETVIEETD